MSVDVAPDVKPMRSASRAGDSGTPLRGNDVAVEATDVDLVELGLALADGNMDTDAVIAWIGSHTAD